MAEARRRALEQYGVELEHEVELARRARAAPLRAVGAAGRDGEVRARWPASERAALASRKRRGRARVAPRCARGERRRPVPRPRWLPPRAAARSSVGSLALASLLAAALARGSRARRRSSRSARSRSAARRPRSRAQVRAALAPLGARASSARRRDAPSGGSRRCPTVAAATLRPGLPAHAARRRRARASRSPSLRRAATRGSSPRAGAVIGGPLDRRAPGAAAHLAAPRRRVARGRDARGDAGGARSRAVRSRWPRRAAPARVRDGPHGPDELTLVLRSGLEVRLGDRRDLRLKLAVARRDPPAAPGRRRAYLDVSVPEPTGRRVQASSLRSEVESSTSTTA